MGDLRQGQKLADAKPPTPHRPAMGRCWAVSWVVLALFTLGAVSSGCRTSRHGSREGQPRVIRAGQPYDTPELELSDDDERLIEAHARFAAGWVEDLSEAPERAIEHFQAAATLDPDNERLTLDSARKLIDLGRLDDARQLLEKSAARTNASGMVWGSLGLVHALQENRPAAIAANEEAVRRMPGNIAAYQMLARVYLGAGQYAEALAVLDEAAKQPGTDNAFLLSLAETFGVLHRVKQPAGTDLRPRLVEILERVAATDPQEAVDLFRLAEQYLQAGSEEKALPYYRRLLAMHPDLPGLRARLIGIYLRSDNWEKAAEQLRAMVAEHPTNPLLHYVLGVLALEGKQIEEAVSAFDKVLLLRPDQEDLHLDVAGAFLTHRQPKEGLRVLDRTRSRFRPTFQLEFFSAIALLDLKRYEEAIRHFTAAEVIGGAFAEDALDHLFYFQSGVAYERAKRFDDAAVQFEKSIERKPDFPDALNYLGYMWAEQGVHLDKALVLIEKAVNLEPENEAYLDSLAWVLHQSGRSAEALPHQLMAIDKAKEPDATLYEHLGDIYQRLGRLDEARQAWKKAQQIEPKPEVQTKIDDTAGTPAK
jgi:tetratricopeptide (TPR) repeat protein